MATPAIERRPLATRGAVVIFAVVVLLAAAYIPLYLLGEVGGDRGTQVSGMIPGAATPHALPESPVLSARLQDDVI